MVTIVIDRHEPTNRKLCGENGYEVQVVAIEILVQMRVVPIVKCRSVCMNELITYINGEVPLEQNVKQVNDQQIDHEKVNDEKSGTPFVLEFRPVYLEHEAKIARR